MTEFTIAFRIFRISEFKPMHSEFLELQIYIKCIQQSIRVFRISKFISNAFNRKLDYLEFLNLYQMHSTEN